MKITIHSLLISLLCLPVTYAASIFDYVTLDTSGNVTGNIGGFNGEWHQEKDYEQPHNGLYGEGGVGTTDYDFNEDGTTQSWEQSTGEALDTNNDGVVSGYNGLFYHGANVTISQDYIPDTIGNNVWTAEYIPHSTTGGLNTTVLTGGSDAQSAWFTQRAGTSSAQFDSDTSRGSWPGFESTDSNSQSFLHFNREYIGQRELSGDTDPDYNRSVGEAGHGMTQKHAGSALSSPLVRWTNPITDANVVVDLNGTSKMNFGGDNQIGQAAIVHYDASLDLYTVLTLLEEDAGANVDGTINHTGLTLSPGDELIFSVRGDSALTDNSQLVSWHSDGISISLQSAELIPEPTSSALLALGASTLLISRRRRRHS